MTISYLPATSSALELVLSGLLSVPNEFKIAVSTQHRLRNVSLFYGQAWKPAPTYNCHKLEITGMTCL
jgi:hypothetical protein